MTSLYATAHVRHDAKDCYQILPSCNKSERATNRSVPARNRTRTCHCNFGVLKKSWHGCVTRAHVPFCPGNRIFPIRTHRFQSIELAKGTTTHGPGCLDNPPGLHPSRDCPPWTTPRDAGVILRVQHPGAGRGAVAEGGMSGTSHLGLCSCTCSCPAQMRQYWTPYPVAVLWRSPPFPWGLR